VGLGLGEVLTQRKLLQQQQQLLLLLLLLLLRIDRVLLP
jgi:hypothetical protein